MLKFSVIAVQFKLLCISVLGHATGKVCSSVFMEYVDCCLDVTLMVRWCPAGISYSLFVIYMALFHLCVLCDIE